MLQAVGLLLTLMVAWIMSANRWRINYWRLVPMFISQVAMAMFMFLTTI
jgi:nucleoside permease NupC